MKLADFINRVRIFPHIEDSTTSSYTDEEAQDAVGAMIDTTLVYTDGTPLLSRAALTGDITASAGSNATTIANDAVTFAKFQNVTGPCVIARETASSGDVAAFPLGTGLSFSGGNLVAAATTPSWLFGTGELGDLTISAGTTTAAASDITFMNYNDLTINGTGKLDLQHRILFVKGTLDLTAAPANAIINIANNGANGANPAGGAGGQSTMTTGYGSFLPFGFGGGTGGNGATTAGNAGNAGATITTNLLGLATPTGAGGNGGAASSSGGNGANNGGFGSRGKLAAPILTVLPSSFFYTPTTVVTGISIALANIGAGAGGGGGGSGAGGLTGGGGGGGGAAGNAVFIYARKIRTSSSTTAGCIAALGGNGGTGANATNANTGGGGGGGGAVGGIVHIICYELERSSGGAIAGGIVATGGAGANGGNGIGTGSAGVGGDGGTGGLIMLYEIKTDTLTIVRGSAGSANSGSTGGAGGACSASL